MRPYRHNPAIHIEEPWWSEVSGTTNRLRYRRGERLSEMRAQLARPRPSHQRPSVRDYRERCIAEWCYYLEHGKPPAETEQVDAAGDQESAR